MLQQSFRAFIVGLSFAAGIGIATAIAATLTSFSSNTQLSSSQMNANFQALNSELSTMRAELDELRDTTAALDTTNVRLNMLESMTYTQEYLVSTSQPLVLVDRQGNDLPRKFLGLYVCGVDDTDASGSSMWLVKRSANGTVYIDRIASFQDTASNTPEVFRFNGAPGIRLFDHENRYLVVCHVTQLLPNT